MHEGLNSLETYCFRMRTVSHSTNSSLVSDQHLLNTCSVTGTVLDNGVTDTQICISALQFILECMQGNVILI